jgi:Omp85 superfamily domain
MTLTFRYIYNKNTIGLFCSFLLFTGNISSQTYSSKEIDLVDLVNIFTHNKIHEDSLETENRKPHFALLPNLGYAGQTGIQAGVGGNLTYLGCDNPKQKISNVLYSAMYCQYHQFISIVQGNLWTKNNEYNIVTDWRYMKFPQKDYGMGTLTTLDNEHLIDYSYLRLYQTILKQVASNLFVGVGYNLDYHWNISETPPSPPQPTDFDRYTNGDKDKTTTSSGITLNFLFDNRLNSINPEGGFYANIIGRSNFTYLASEENWQSVLIDVRKYFKVSEKSKNILAFWTYNTFTFGGNAPYLDLPNTGGDEFSNSGRGYIQSRFRGRNMLYLESEYRFRILKNDFLGGVVFANAQSLSEWNDNSFEKIAPAIGAGLRIKMNKHSRTNASIDYGFGLDSRNRGLFLNLGECF